MFPNQLIQRVKKARLPYYITYEDLDEPITAFSGETDSVHQLRHLFWLPEPINPPNIINSLMNNQAPNHLDFLKPPESTQTINPNLNRYNAKVDTLLKEYIDKSSFVPQLATKRLKCSSLERISPAELCRFSTYKHLLKTTKKTVKNSLMHKLTINIV